MKIALVIEKFDPNGGGAERSTAQIANELRKAGHDVTIIAGAVGTPESIAGYNVLTLNMQGRFGALKLSRFVKWARQQLQQGGYDASLSVTTTVPASVVQPRSGTLKETFARNVAIRTSVAAKLFKRLTLLLSPKHQLLLALERRTLRDPLVKRFAAISGYVQKQLVEGYSIDPARISIIPNAAAMPVVTPQQRQAWRDEVRKGFSVPDDALVFAYAALNPRLKGAHTLISAAAILKKRGLQNFVILMAGSMGYRQQHQAAQLDVRDCIRFIGATKHMDRLYCASDVTVLPTYYDPSSKVVIESLMLGVPAISTKYNGASDMILPGEGIIRGRVINDPGNAEELADAMQQLADPAARAQCASMSEGLSDSLSMATHVQRLTKLFEEASRA
jgi:UDP-glucose:(heptosyl)LPS alpha-1,3-glucosyltransferase